MSELKSYLDLKIEMLRQRIKAKEAVALKLQTIKDLEIELAVLEGRCEIVIPPKDGKLSHSPWIRWK